MPLRPLHLNDTRLGTLPSFRPTRLDSTSRMRGRSNTVFAPLPSQDSAPPPPGLDLSSTAQIPPTPESPPHQSRMNSPRRMSQLRTPTKSSRRRSGTVSQGNRGGNLPTPAHSSNSEDDETEGIMGSERVRECSKMAQTSQEEVDESRRGNSRARMSVEGDGLVEVGDRLEKTGDMDEEQDPMLQQIARERRLVWEQSRSKSFGRKKWLILIVSFAFSTARTICYSLLTSADRRLPSHRLRTRILPDIRQDRRRVKTKVFSYLCSPRSASTPLSVDH